MVGASEIEGRDDAYHNVSSSTSKGNKSLVRARRLLGLLDTHYGLAITIRLLATICNFTGMAFLVWISTNYGWAPVPGLSDLFFLPGVAHSKPNWSSIGTYLNCYILLTFTVSHVDAAVCLYYPGQVTLVNAIAHSLTRKHNVTAKPEVADYVAVKADTFSPRDEKCATCVRTWLAEKLNEETWAFHTYNKSFTAEYIVQSAFATLYGSLNLWMSRDGPGQRNGIKQNPNTWGFGQIVPMVLLLLPLLAGCEAYRIYKQEDDATSAHVPMERRLPYFRCGAITRNALDAGLEMGPMTSSSVETQGWPLPAPSSSRPRNERFRALPSNKTSSRSQIWRGNGLQPFEKPYLRRKIWLEAATYIIMTLFLAISTALNPLNNKYLFCISRVTFGYSALSEVRALYGVFFAVYCFRKDNPIQTDHTLSGNKMVSFQDKHSLPIAPTPSNSPADPKASRRLSTVPHRSPWVPFIAWLVSCGVRIACIIVFAYYALKYWGEGDIAFGEALLTSAGPSLAVTTWFLIAIVP